VENLLVVNHIRSIPQTVVEQRRTRFFVVVSPEAAQSGLVLLVVNSESQGKKVVVDAEQVSAVVYVITGAVEVGASLDRTHGHVQEETLVGQLHDAAIVEHVVLVVISLHRLDHSSEDHDLLAGDLDGACMDNPQFLVVVDVVYGLPNVALKVECFHFLHKFKGELVADSRLGLQALAADNENVFFIELAYTEGLPRFFKVGHHNPLFASDREELTGVQRLDKWSSARLFVAEGHSSDDIDVILKLVDDVLGPREEHVVEGLEQRPVLVEHVGFVQELVLGGVEATYHKQVSLGSHHIAGVLGDIELVLDHNGLRHVIQDFIGVDELGFVLEVEDPGQHALFETVFKLEIAREVGLEEAFHLFLHFLARTRIGE